MENIFDNLLSLKEASDLYGFEESTLRKAIAFNKFVVNKDIRKFGKQWVITKQALEREYGIKDNNQKYSEYVNNCMINYLVIDAINGYSKSFNLNKEKTIKLFIKKDIIKHLIDNYDYYHIQSVNQTIKEIHKIIYEKQN